MQARHLFLICRRSGVISMSGRTRHRVVFRRQSGDNGFPSAYASLKQKFAPRRFYSTSNMQRTKLIIDSDLGTDDACALILAFSHPNVDVLALTTVFGNVSLSQAIANANRIRRLTERYQVPIFAGASGPLISSEEDEVNSNHYHGQDGLGDTPETFPPALPSDFETSVKGKHAAQAIIETVRSNPGCTVLCLGPLTNLALALKLDPNVGNNINHVYMMGGNTRAVGNVVTGHTAEYNFYKDPEAAHIVFTEANCPITAVPWEAYLDHPCSEEFTKAYTQNDRTTRGRFVQAILRNPLSSLETLQFGLCDELATAIAIDNSIIVESLNRHYATVELHGRCTRGQVAIDHRVNCGRKANVEFVTKVDMAKAERMLLDSLKDIGPDIVNGV